jgi:hypothetical protein
MSGLRSLLSKGRLSISAIRRPCRTRAPVAQAVPSRISRRRSAEDDEFVEVHIWGPLSVRAVERVFWKASSQYKKAFRLELRDRLRKVDVELVEAI